AGTVLSGCYARGPAFAPKTLAGGKAIAYVYRPCTSPDGAASGRTEEIWINGSDAGRLRCEGYLAQELDPGQVHIEAGEPPSGAHIATRVALTGLIFIPFIIAEASKWGRCVGGI